MWLPLFETINGDLRWSLHFIDFLTGRYYGNRVEKFGKTIKVNLSYREVLCKLSKWMIGEVAGNAFMNTFFFFDKYPVNNQWAQGK